MNTKITESAPALGQHSIPYRLRVFTLGPFRIEWVDPATGQPIPLPAERLSGQNAANALGLLQALLSKPGRFATRSWLLEQFWPNSPLRSAEERLNDVASSLRCLLRAEGDKSSLVHFVYGNNQRGAGYRLEGYPRIWCDADAFEWYVNHALLLEQRGQDATACWERAYAFSQRGEYLPERIEEDWSRQHRDFLQGLQRDCVQHWTQQLRQAGQVDEAILRLRSYWLEHLTDEDALRPLLEMLGECERFREAEAYYAKARDALAEDKFEPDERTNEAIEMVRALKIQRKQAQQEAGQPSATLPLASPSFSLPLEVPLPPPSGPFRDTMLPRSYAGEQRLKHSRRQILSGMLTTAYTLLALPPYLSLELERQEPLFAAIHGLSPLSEEVLASLEEITRSYWKLAANLSLPLLSGIQGHFQSVMQLLHTPQGPESRQALFSLASENAQILGKTLCDLRDYSLALSYYAFAMKAALEANNNDLQVAALGRIALLFLSTDQPQRAIGCLQEIQSIPHSQKLRSWCAAIEAEAYSYANNSKLCMNALLRAKDVSRETFEEADPYATGFTASRLASYEGSCYLHLNQPEKALPILQEARKELEPTAIRSLSRLLTYEGMAYALLGDVQQVYRNICQALDFTQQTQSIDILHHIQLLSKKLVAERATTNLQDLTNKIQSIQVAITHLGDIHE